jgi:hypothetical protein
MHDLSKNVNTFQNPKNHPSHLMINGLERFVWIPVKSRHRTVLPAGVRSLAGPPGTRARRRGVFPSGGLVQAFVFARRRAGFIHDDLGQQR